MTTMVTLINGHDVRYYTNGGGAGGCAGAMAYYTKAGEPPGQWHDSRATGKLGLAGEVDPQVLERLFMENVAPTGEVLARRQKAKNGEKAALAAYKKAHPYASQTELDEFLAAERAKASHTTVPYVDLTTSAVKSVSVLHASYQVDAVLARERGDHPLADALDAKADAIEAAVINAAGEAVDYMQKHHTFTRTGHHGKDTGEWRDGDGLVAAMFLHHLSREGDPQLHVHAAVWNRTQRADAADEKWRTLFVRDMMRNKLGMAPVPDRFLERRLRELGYVMVKRADGNGCEVAGVSEEIMQMFSSRGVAIGKELKALAAEYERVHGQPPSRRTLWLLRQQAGQNTRRPKAESRRTVNGKVHQVEPTAAERLKEWEANTARTELDALSKVWPEVERVARDAARERAPEGAPDPAPDDAKLPPVPGVELSGDEQRTIARIAVTQAQKHHAAWSMAHLRFEIHRALPPGATEKDVDIIAARAAGGVAGVAAVQLGAAPDIADVSSLGLRASDGASVYRPPHEEKWATLDHLKLEEHIVNTARTPKRQLVPEPWAREQVAKTDLNADQAEMVVQLLTAQRMTIPVNAAGGSGKSHAMGEFARLWTSWTGGRVIGLTTSTNAARVLEGEMADAGAGLAECYNIAQFVGKIKDSDELRWPIPVHEGDVLILDEATQASTADVALVQQAAVKNEAFLHPIGDTEQLGSVDAGGMFHQLVTDLGGLTMSEVLRFRHQWERDASLRIRDGDIGAIAAYKTRGRIFGADEKTAKAQAATSYLSDLLRGRETLLLAGSNAEAVELARHVQQMLRDMGKVGEGRVELSDGNVAGVGDRIRARLNSSIDAGGQLLTNRDTLRITKITPNGRLVTAERKTGPKSWSGQFTAPAAYLAGHAELDYAGNGHVAQGRTVDVSHGLVSQTLDRRGLYVESSRGREANYLYVETGNTAPPGKPAYEQATPESVIKGIMEKDNSELSATEQMRAAQEWAGGTGHVLHLWSQAVHRSLYPAIDAKVMARLTPDQADRYQVEHAREAFHARMREAQLSGHDISELVDRVTADPLDGARSVSAVLYSRLEGLGLDERPEATWVQRTPEDAPPLARELAAGLDDRARELGVRYADKPEPWLADHLGVLRPDASPALRADYERRAGIATSYREAAGITHPAQAVAAEPHTGNPELETARLSALTALEIQNEEITMRQLSIGQLEARVAAGEQAMTMAPPDVSRDLEETSRGMRLAWANNAEHQSQGAQVEAANEADLARLLEERKAELDPQQAVYDAWSAQTAQVREAAGKAAAELGRREVEQGVERGDLIDWYREFDEHMAAVEDAIDRHQHLALEDGAPWPPPPGPAPEPDFQADDASWWAGLGEPPEVEPGELGAEPAPQVRGVDSPGPPLADSGEATVETRADGSLPAPQASGAGESGEAAAPHSLVLPSAEQPGGQPVVQTAAEYAPADPEPASGQSSDPPQLDAADAPRAAGPVSPRGVPPEPPSPPGAPAPDLDEPEPINVADWEQWRAEQTARIEADRQAGVEASASATPVTDAEIAKYGPAAEPAQLPAELPVEADPVDVPWPDAEPPAAEVEAEPDVEPARQEPESQLGPEPEAAPRIETFSTEAGRSEPAEDGAPEPDEPDGSGLRRGEVSSSRDLEPITIQRSDAEWRMDNARLDAEAQAKEAERQAAAQDRGLQVDPEARVETFSTEVDVEADEPEPTADERFQARTEYLEAGRQAHADAQSAARVEHGLDAQPEPGADWQAAAPDAASDLEPEA